MQSTELFLEADPQLRRGLTFGRGFAITGSVFALTLISLFWDKGPGVSWLYQFKSQDFLWLAVLALFWGVLLRALVKLETRGAEQLFLPASRSGRWLLPLAIAVCFLFSWIGTHTIYHGYSLSLDEFIDLFQVQTFLSGDLIARVDEEWRAFGFPLQPVNIKYDAANAFWYTGVLPVRAAFQTLFALLGDVALAEAFAAAMSVLLLFLIARIIRPQQQQFPLVALLFLLGSTQFLITSISPYAMTTMLFFGALWLYLYLRDTPLSHLLGVVVLFLASGLHHWQNFPIFVIPFLLGMIYLRQWKLLLLYGSVALISALFWKAWPAFSLHHWYDIVRSSNGPKLSVAGSALKFLYRRDAQDIINWLVNLYRFVAWQHLLLIPMLYVAIRNWRAMPPVLRVIAAGIAFQIAVYTVLYPTQGHGWGYRFIHEQLVGLALVAAFGWERASNRLQQLGINPMPLLIGSSMIMLLLALPLRAVQTEQSVAPYAAADRYIKQIDADIVLLDIRNGWYSQDLVRNRPDLSNRPLVMALQTLSAEQIEMLCDRYDTRYVLFDDLYRLGLQPASGDLLANGNQSMSYRNELNAKGCTKSVYQPR